MPLLITQARAYHYDVVVSPVITEKSTACSRNRNKVIFNVRLDATKEDIKSSVEALFNVKVAKVNTLRRLGKEKAVSATPSANCPTN